MEVEVKAAYKTHKRAENEADCADHFCVNPKNNKFAVSDGVSQSFMPSLWAETLVNQFCKKKEFRIKNCRNIWQQKVKENADSANWLMQIAISEKRSAAATLLTLEIKKKKFEITARGDSCLFFMPDNNRHCGLDPQSPIIFPEITEFTNHPDFYDSYCNHRGETLEKKIPSTNGVFYLMTDALAEYTQNNKNEAFGLFDSWTSQAEFEAGIELLRESGKLKDDDTTLLIIHVKL